MIVTHSSMECFCNCRRKYQLRYLDCIVPKVKSQALEFGSAMHAVLERYFKAIKAEQQFEGESTIDKESMKEDLQVRVEGQDLNIVDTAKLLGLTLGYVNRWFETDVKEFEVVDVEREFRFDDFVDGVSLSGKVDGLVKRKDDGRYYILEHKTASVVDDSYVMQKDIDAQTMMYAICLQEILGINVSGVIHDILTKQKIRLKKGETEDDFCVRLIDDVCEDNFNRITIDFRDGTLEDFQKELEAKCEEISRCKTFYRCTGNCIGRYGACEYLTLCASRATGSTTPIEDNYETRRAHEELSAETVDE